MLKTYWREKREKCNHIINNNEIYLLLHHIMLLRILPNKVTLWKHFSKI